MKETQLLKVVKLNISISGKPILKKISFGLNKNETLGIVGESGSGKSITALSIISLLDQKKIKKTGKILFANKRIDNLAQGQLEKIRGSEISIVFQEPMSSLNPSMRCGEQILESILNHQQFSINKGKKRVFDLIKMVKIKDPVSTYKKYPHELSGGQQQRIMIAIAISCNPKILIADEPTTSLDPVVKKEILLLIKDIQNQTSMSVIFISHDLNLISQLTNRVMVLKDGKLIESGNSQEVLENPKMMYTKMLLNSKPPTKTRPVRLPTIENNLKKYKSLNAKKRKSNFDKIYTKKPILNVRNLSVAYKNKPILKNISFSLFKGETLGLIGESGSGKSTIAKAILNLVSIDKGKVFYKNNDIQKIDKKKFRKDFQLIFQDPYSSLNQEKNIGFSILEPMLAHNILNNLEERKNAVYSLLESVGLNKDDYVKYPNQFSGGQRQRIVIARALSVMPKVVICDESVSALDVSVQAQILNLLNDLKEKYSITFLFISHDMSVIKYMCDRVIVLKNGKIEELNYTDDFFASPKTKYSTKLIESTTFI